MKTKIVVFIILIVLATCLFFFIKSKQRGRPSNELWHDYTVIKKTIDGKELRLIVADTPERWGKGLMYVRKPVTDFDGMIFIFPLKQPKTFWNMNTFEDLKLYWMDNETIVGTSDLPSIIRSKDIVRVSSEKPVNRVIEVIQ